MGLAVNAVDVAGSLLGPALCGVSDYLTGIGGGAGRHHTPGVPPSPLRSRAILLRWFKTTRRLASDDPVQLLAL